MQWIETEKLLGKPTTENHSRIFALLHSDLQPKYIHTQDEWLVCTSLTWFGLPANVYIPALIANAETELAEEKRLCKSFPALDAHHPFIWQSWGCKKSR